MRECVDSRGILIGTAVRPQLFSERAYSYTLARGFNMVEAEDAMKWWVLRPDAATFDFTQADRVVDFAEAHRMKVRGQTLAWGWSNPSWLSETSFSPAQLSNLLQEHIAKVVTRYRGRVFAWDVVNEAFEESGALKTSVWYGRPGIGFAGKSTAFIEQVFRRVHEADPQALLFYNDNGAETADAKSDAIYAMVKDFKARGVPIDGVGMQMHIFDLQADAEGISRNIARSRYWAFRCTSPKWMSRFRSTTPGMQALPTLPGKSTSIGPLHPPALRTPVARPFRPGASLTSIRGSDGKPRAPRETPYSLTGITRPNPRSPPSLRPASSSLPSAHGRPLK